MQTALPQAPVSINPHMRQIVFATNNAHKLDEARQILSPLGLNVLSLADIGCHTEIPETGTTLDANAQQKALFIKENFGYDCFADDTGLEVDALQGAPGVYSARYAGPAHDSLANMRLLLKNLEGAVNRKARFRTVVALIIGSDIKTVSGECPGEITNEPQGEAGFGYDPVFRPEGYDLTFAQMEAEQKNAISHRGRAMEQLAELLNNL
ncbi:MAG: RdgB/HAM1 family non-canonical purine NTP pyrophosphatase [Muribaculum sp.]|nr:RdgB/HAM1 family non-canonical purine NTP pyrophosphatase [Muribaculaceae bacterium]MCM1081731.1 RdgB/HAM1 family non-canonical purine NTP pyrophosphatase [Muribaculum sp.]